MGLTNNQKNLIEAVSAGNLPLAKKCAIACLAEDTTQKNRFFTAKYTRLLEGQPEEIKVPMNLEGKLLLEEVAGPLLERRYYVSAREQKVFETIRRMCAVSEKLQEKKIPYTNATMLYGPSGTGKTTFGKLIAARLGLPFCYLNFSSLVDSLLGKTAQNLSLAFNFVKTMPCVFMIDEIDTIALRRGAQGDTGASAEMNRVTITLIQELDQLPAGIVLLGATNRIDMVDEAILRRFPLQHEIRVFSEEESQAMVEQYLCDVEMDDRFKGEKDKDMIRKLICDEKVQGRIMSGLVRHIAEKLYEETK